MIPQIRTLKPHISNMATQNSLTIYSLLLFLNYGETEGEKYFCGNTNDVTVKLTFDFCI